MQINGEKVATFSSEDSASACSLDMKGTKNRHSCSTRTQMAKDYVPINPDTTPIPLPKDSLMIH